MSWLRIGDTASMHPVVLRSLELPNATESLKLEHNLPSCGRRPR